MRAVVDPGDQPVPHDLPAAVRAVLRRAARELRVGAGDVALRFIGEEEMRTLNARWRGKDSPTDVLSFPSGVRSPDGRLHIGDIAICWPVAVEQARRRGHSARREVELLALHGLLHLLGHDHETDDGEMDALERRLRRRLFAEARGAR